jgi:hypothetical protein
MSLKVANLNTQMGDRFVMKAADPGVEIFNNVAVSSYAADLPSKGGVSAFIKGVIREGGRNGEDVTQEDGWPVYEDPTDLFETITFSSTTQFTGDISSFAKAMSYNSMFA